MNGIGNYGLHSQFNIEKHKATFKDYLEAIIDRNGTIMYAVPSHTMKAEALAMEKLNKTRKEISDMCPREFYFDYINWLLSLTDSVAVWSSFVMAPKITKAHVDALQRLKSAELYTGRIPDVGATERGYE